MNDNLGLFYLDPALSYSSAFKEIRVSSRIMYGDSEIDEIESKIRSIITAIRAKHNTDKLGDYEKEVIIHDSLVKNIKYFKGGLERETQTIVGGLIKRRCVCTGYAASFKMLCDLFEIPCIIVNGTAVPRERDQVDHASREDHAWNIVRLNGVCSHVDITWDSTSKGDLEKCYDNFNLTDSDIVRDHTWDRELLPACNSISNNWYYRNGCCINSIEELKKYISVQLSLGRKIIPVRFENMIEDQQQILNAVKSALYRPKAMMANALSVLAGFSMNIYFNKERGTVTIVLN